MEPLLIVLIVISLLILVSLVANNSKSKTNLTTNFDITQTNEFKHGINHGFSLVQIVLYKMWKESEILDFDNMNDTVKNNILEITQDKTKLMKWNEEYMSYIKSKERKDDF
jgi:hypothetical protein